MNYFFSYQTFINNGVRAFGHGTVTQKELDKAGGIVEYILSTNTAIERSDLHLIAFNKI